MSRVAVVAVLVALSVGTVAGSDSAPPGPTPVEVPVPPVTMRLIEEGRSLPIDLATAITLAGAKNLDVLAARARLAEARGNRNEALGRLVPEYTGSFTAKKIDGRIQASFGELDRRAFSTLIPAATVELRVNPGQAVFDALAAHRNLAAAEHETEQVNQDVLAVVAVRYMGLLEAQARVKIAEEAHAAARKLARVARDRESGGVGLKVDALRGDARAAADEVRLAQARNTLRDASVALAMLLKLDPAVTLFPIDTVVREHALVDLAGPLQSLVARGVANPPDLAAGLRRVKAATSAHYATWAGALGPSVYGSFEESAIGRSTGDLGDRQIYGGYVGFRLSPASIGQVQAAEARLEQIRLQAERLEQQVTAEVIRAREKVLTTREEIEASLRGLRAAEAAHEFSQVRFKGGVGIGLEVLDAQAALSESRTNLVTAIVGYDTAEVRLLWALGGVSVPALLQQAPSP